MGQRPTTRQEEDTDMSRRHAAEKREVLPDAKYGDLVLTKFMNNLMIDGKKICRRAYRLQRDDPRRRQDQTRPDRSVPRSA